MFPASKQRRIEIFLDGQWSVVPSFGLLEVGDVIRMFEPDGTVVMSEGSSIFVVSEQPIVVVDPRPLT
jgi:hypothetical protein